MRNVAEQHQGLEEENGPPDEDVNAVEVFRDFHTSRKNGMSDAQWCELVEIWSSAKNKVCVNPSISCLVLLWSTCAAV